MLAQGCWILGTLCSSDSRFIPRREQQARRCPSSGPLRGEENLSPEPWGQRFKGASCTSESAHQTGPRLKKRDDKRGLRQAPLLMVSFANP